MTGFRPEVEALLRVLAKAPAQWDADPLHNIAAVYFDGPLLAQMIEAKERNPLFSPLRT